ncbi:MAG: ArsR family transcriptional regulator [Candidatus Omnitrophota bacterium]
MKKRIEAFKNDYRQNVALLGPELIGKTSLVLELLNQHNDKTIIPVYVEVKSEPLQFFVQKFIGVFLNRFITTVEHQSPEDLNLLIKKCRQHASKTYLGIKDVFSHLENNNNNEAFVRLLQLPVIFYAETNKRCLIAIDEFQNLETLKINNPFKVLSNAIMMQKTTMYIITSSWEAKARQILSEKLSLLFGNFETLHITSFDMPTSKFFLDKKLMDIEMQDLCKKFLYNLTMGKPFYLDLIVERLKRLFAADKTKKMTRELIIDALNDLLFDPRGILHQYFEHHIGTFLQNRTYCTFSLILNALADGQKRTAGISKYTNRPVKDITQHLSQLINMEIVQRSGSFNRLHDPMLKLWLKYVYKTRQQNYSTNPQMLSTAFNMAIDDNFTAFCDTDRKNLGEILLTLFESFGNEIVEIGKKRFKLSKFKKVELKNQSGFCYIIATPASSQKQWICLLENKLITEQDIIDFSQYLRNAKLRPIRKIIVTIRTLDVNAKLKALEDKFIIWEIETLNSLLDLYSRCGVVRW